MPIRYFSSISLIFLLLGVTVAGFWVYFAGGLESLASVTWFHPGYILPLLAATASCVLMRFVRWQFLLRRVGVRVPIRSSFSIFLASLVGIATPAYLGEGIRSIFMRKKFGIPFRITISVLIVERLLDVAALGIVGAITAHTWWVREVMLLLVVAALLVGLVWGSVARNIGVPPPVITQLRNIGIMTLGLGISFIAWVPATQLVSLSAASFGIWVTRATGMRIFSTSTLLGGLTLMPAGVGSMGSSAIFQLQDIGLTLTQSVVIVSLVRIMSIGISLIVGVLFLLLQIKAQRQGAFKDSTGHFNEIAQEYKEQFPAHIWNRLLDRKISLLTAALPYPSSATGVGLDLGCGLGHHCLAMSKRGYSVVGVDVAQNLVQQAHLLGATVTNGNVLALPFKNSSFEFVYAVGVLHHLPEGEAQEAAWWEAVRVLKPGGLFIVHETNPRNPLFRFYMGYVFPLFKRIDEGIEYWIEPQRWERLDRMKLIDLQYFTFLPDFAPQWLMRYLLAVERRLETSSLRSYSVHYMMVFQKHS